MGYNITPQQQKQMRASLDIDESGRVVFMEFTKLAQDMFAFKLDDAHLETNLMLALSHKEDLEMPPMPRKVSNNYTYRLLVAPEYHSNCTANSLESN